MNFAQFCKISSVEFDSYFTKIDQALVTGQFQTNVPDPVPSLPQLLVLVESPTHYFVELVGSRRRHKPLRLCRRKIDDRAPVFGQFVHPPGSNPSVTFHGDDSGVSGMAFITGQTQREVERRFPGVLNSYVSQLSFTGEQVGPALGVGDRTNFFRVENTLLVNSLSGAVRIKAVSFMLAITRDTTPLAYAEYLRGKLSLTNGAQLVGAGFVPEGHAQILRRVADFANVFLMDKLHETAIGAFLDEHRDILLSAFDAVDLVTEPELPWQMSSPDPDESAINPDFFIQRPDGYWDVGDLKLALLHKRDITRGSRNRRRFIATVDEGIAQLAHYKETIAIPEHAQYLKKRYDVEFRDPRSAIRDSFWSSATTRMLTPPSSRRRSVNFKITSTSLTTTRFCSSTHYATVYDPGSDA